MEDNALEEKALETLVDASRTCHFTNCICSSSNQEKTQRKLEKISFLFGWRPASKVANSQRSAGRAKKNLKTTNGTINSKNKLTRSNNLSKISNEDRKNYFHHHQNRIQHIENYRSEFSTVKMISNSDVQWLDPYMPEKGNQGQLLMRIKLLETLSEICKYDSPNRDLRGKWNGLPPIRLANAQELRQKCGQDRSRREREASFTRQDDERLSSRGNFPHGADVQNEFQLMEAVSLEDNTDAAAKISKKERQCSTVRDEDLISMEISCQQQSSYPHSTTKKHATSYLHQNQSSSHLTQLSPRYRNPATFDSYKSKEDLDKKFLQPRNDVARNNVFFGFSDRKYASAQNHRGNASKQDNLSGMTEKTVGSIPYKRKGNPLYISILGKSPICRESYDDSN